MRNRFRISFAIAAFGFIAVSPPALAVRNVYCVNCATSAQAATIATILTAQLERVVRAIQGQSLANTNSAENTSRVTAEADAKTQADMETSRSRIKYEPLDPCASTALTNATTGADGDVTRDRGAPLGRGGGGGVAIKSGLPGASDPMKKTILIGKGMELAPNPEVQGALASRGGCETFASGGVRSDACQKAGFRTSVLNGHPNADVLAETLFDGPQKKPEEKIVRRLTYKKGSPEETAVEAFLRNIETGIDLRALTAGELKTDAGRKYLALRDAYEASMSVASKPARDQAMMLRATEATKDIIEQLLRSDDKQFVEEYLRKAYPQYRSDGISFAELINLEAERRYRNPKWYERIAAAPDRQLLQEMVQMQATQLWMTTIMLERLQQIAVIQGGVAASALRAERMPQLAAAHRAAQR